MRKAALVALVAVAASVAHTGVAGAAPKAPPATTSRYMKTTDPAVLDRLGCDQGRAGESGVVVLAFGAPAYNGTYFGTIIFGANNFRSVVQIEAAAKAFLTGYWRCSPATTHITLVVGTSNYRGNTSHNHGRAWANMINNILAWIGQRGYGSQEDVAGGSDMELDWNTPAATRAWVGGYDTIDVRPVYNFGDAAGCPPYGSCNNGWAQEDVWFISWGAPPAWPLPEIYTTNGSMAQQWYRLSLYARLAHGNRMNISGAFTQWQACRDVGGCSNGTDNTPSAGWTQLWNALNADARTAQALAWSTDITWKN